MGDQVGLRIALLGTRGVPARYGGFETAVEEIGAELANRGHDVTVYCRSESASGRSYRGMRRIVVPSVKRKALETLTHTGLSALHALRHRPDVALVFNAANAPFVALLRLGRVPAATATTHAGRSGAGSQRSTTGSPPAGAAPSRAPSSSTRKRSAMSSPATRACARTTTSPTAPGGRG